MLIKLKWYILGLISVFLLGGTTAYALSVQLPTSVKKGDLLVGSSTNSSLYTVSTGTPGSVLWVGSSGVPAWTATSTLGISGGGGGGSIATSTDAQIGKVAVWTGQATLGNSLLFDNGTVAGVNATSSTITFNLQGTAGANDIFNVSSSTGISVLRVTNNQRVGIGSTSPTATLVVQGTSTAPTLPVFAVASSTNTQLFTVLGNGNVGVGNITPAYKFTVAAPTTLIGDNGTLGGSAGILNIYKAAATPGDVLLSIGSNQQTDQVVVRAAQALNFGSYGVQAGDLYVGQLAQDVDRIVSNQNTNNWIDWFDTATGQMIFQTGNVTGYDITFKPGATERLRLAKTGNIGISSSTPNSRLTVQGIAGSTTPLFTLASSTSVALFSVDSKGFVGVGTSTPLNLFTVTSSGTTTPNFDSVSASQGACLKLKDADGSGYTYCVANNGTLSCSTASCE